MPPLIVTAAVIEDPAGRILITRRPAGGLHGSLWEFPGGKLEEDETPEAGLSREIREELDIAVTVGAILAVVHHRYDWGAVLLLAYRCRPLQFEIRNLGVAEHRWVAPTELGAYDFLPADGPIVAACLAMAPWPTLVAAGAEPAPG